MTLSNRITFAGAIPMLVALALAILVAAIVFAPLRPASAANTADTCDLSPVILDMLLDRYGLADHQCNDLELDPIQEDTSELDDEVAKDNIWDFSDQSLSSFEITDEDAETLQALTGSTSITEMDVRYIDLTGNPLTADDVDFKHIPSNVAVILSAESNIAGFQQTDYEITEGVASYISVAFPNLLEDEASSMEITVDISGDSTDEINNAALGGNNDASGGRIQLVTFGTGLATAAERTFAANSDREDVIFYWPITVRKDNTNEDEWDITLAIDEETGIEQNSAAVDVDLGNNDEADVTIIDADAPAVSVCARSEDAQESIMAAVVDADDAALAIHGLHDECEDLTIRDLGALTELTVVDVDDDDKEPLEALVTGDFADLIGLTTLKLIGARALPSGIFADVGKDAKLAVAGTDTTVQITFANNSPEDLDDDSVGNFTPSTIPAHIWADQEAGQVIILADDEDDDGNGVTKGLDADIYAATEGEHFFVLTNAATAAYILDDSVLFNEDFVADRPAITIQADPDPQERGDAELNSRVVRFAVPVLDNEEEDGERSTWLFLFGDADGDDNPEHAGDLVDLARVVISDAD